MTGQSPLSRSAGPWGSRGPMGPKVGSPVDSPGGWKGPGEGAAGALLRVLSADLRGRVAAALLLHLEAGLAGPGPLQFILHVDGELADSLGLDLDLVAVHKRVQAAMVGAGGQDVARLQRVDRRDPLDAPRDVVRHVVGVEVLHQDAAVPESNLEVL